MALYSVSLRLAHDVTWPERRKWTNRFHFEATNPEEAVDKGLNLWIGFLRGAASERVFCYEVYATDLDETTNNYLINGVPPAFQRGQVPWAGGAQQYLLKAVASITLPVDGFSRPSRKFWRFGFSENDVVSGVTLENGVLNSIITAFNGAIAEPTLSLLDESGVALSQVSRIRLTTREFGRNAGNDVPLPPAFG